MGKFFANGAADMLERLKLMGKEVILVGTAHISAKSIELVKETIEKEKPDVVGIELDAQRYYQLQHAQQWQETNLGEIIKEGRTYLFLLNLLLANLQRKLGEQVGIKPGEEMIAAINAAEQAGATVVLLDRDVRITLKRALNAMSLREKLKLGYGILAGFFQGGEEALTQEKIEELKQRDIMTELMQQLSREMPSVKRVLVDERDAFIAHGIMHAEGRKIVAVLGAGHLDGVKKFLGEKINVPELLALPRKRNLLRALKYAVPLLFFVFIAYGFYAKGIAATLNIFAVWFLITGTLAALGAAIARAHPFSILTAFFAAPFTTLHPALAAGWFAGMVELRIRQPKVRDFEKLRKLNTFREFASNPVTRVLLVTAFANLGSSAGAIIALPYALSLLQ